MITLTIFENPLLSGKDEVLKIIQKTFSSDTSNYISIVDAVVINRLIENKEYHEVLKSFDTLICDSSLIMFLNNLKHNERNVSYNGPDFFRDSMNDSKNRQLLLGATEEDFNKIKAKSKNENLHYFDVGFNSDYRKFNYSAIENYINTNKIDIVWVMLGNPKQDFFSSELKRRNNLNTIVISSGAAYLFYLEQIKHGSKTFFGLKFLWINRLIQNPKIQIKRALNVILRLRKIYKTLK